MAVSAQVKMLLVKVSRDELIPLVALTHITSFRPIQVLHDNFTFLEEFQADVLIAAHGGALGVLVIRRPEAVQALKIEEVTHILERFFEVHTAV